MPTISAFSGIDIRTYDRDLPPPHFHATYGEHRALVAIATGQVIEGRLPSTARRSVLEWTFAHRPGLTADRERAGAGVPLERIVGSDDDRGRRHPPHSALPAPGRVLGRVVG